MPTAADLMKLARKGPVSIQSLQTEFGLSEAEACRVLKACWDRGLLVPSPRSWFGILNEDGSLPYAKSGEGSSAWGPEQKLSWYDPEIKLVWEVYEGLDGLGLTVKDVVDGLHISQPRARKILEVLVEVGELERQEADAGGAYGRRPLIYYRPDEPERYEARNQAFLDMKKERKKKQQAARRALKKVNAEKAEEEPQDDGVVWEPVKTVYRWSPFEEP